ncbi:hypothetical protein GCM10028790_50310 [Micromonospora taraxaci]
MPGPGDGRAALASDTLFSPPIFDTVQYDESHAAGTFYPNEMTPAIARAALSESAKTPAVVDKRAA